MATAAFADANAWIEPLPAIRQLPLAARIALMYVPYAILLGVLWFYARVWDRVRGHVGWFVALVVAAVAVLFTTYALPVLILLVALVLLQLGSRAGTLYEASSFPSIRAFVGLTFLLAMSLRWGGDVLGIDFLWELAKLPRDVLMLIVAAVAVAAFIAIGGLRHRRVQPCGAAGWLTAGIVLFILGFVAARLPSSMPQLFFAANAMLIAGHVALFVGSFLLLTHLLPSREADRQH